LLQSGEHCRLAAARNFQRREHGLAVRAHGHGAIAELRELPARWWDDRAALFTDPELGSLRRRAVLGQRHAWWGRRRRWGRGRRWCWRWRGDHHRLLS